MSCRLPGATDPDALWRSVVAGSESITELSRDALLAAGEDPAAVDRPEYVARARVLADIAGFDAGLFGFTAREAELLDPQQRLFLECALEALEGAGHGARERRGAVGVFAGATTSTYLLHNLLRDPALVGTLGAYHLFLHNDKDFLATRAAYKLDLRGPAMTVQTGCSTSLVAVHLACQSLLEGECSLALAGGASIRVPDRLGYLYQQDMIFSPDGRCRPFDAAARGTVAGSGVAVVALRRLEDALTSGDPIFAVIRGSAVNNDGARKVGYTAPSVDGQARVIAEALDVADVRADSIGYVEAHGTATPLGDPIEVASLTRAYRAHTQRRQYCALGSLKANIGHLDAAAGVAGLIKAVLALRYAVVPPCAGFTAPNPQLHLESSPFYVPTQARPWAAGDEPRRAAVSSFGIGGTNAHVILEEAPPRAASGPSRPSQVLVLAGRSPAAVTAAAQRLADHLEQQPAEALADVAHTLAVGREPHTWRRAVVGRDPADAIAALRREAPAHQAPADGRARPVAFMFPGGGAQYLQMGRGLYERESGFRATIDRAARHLEPILGLDVRPLIYADAGPEDVPAAALRLQRASIAMPALLMTEYALARLWIDLGVAPQMMIGHSFGEYVAATLAGVFSLEDALTLVARRGQLMEGLPAGAMTMVALSEAELRPLLGPAVAIAAVNGPGMCVTSGPPEAIAALERRVADMGVDHQRVAFGVAAHSPAVDAILDAFAASVRRVALHPPQIPVISNLSGHPLTAAEATSPDYWVAHLRATVRFADGLATVLKDPEALLLEVGPGTTLGTIARAHPAHGGRPTLGSLRHPKQQQPDLDVMVATLGELWTFGVSVDWPAFFAGEQRRRVPLPTYPFERRRYWVEPGSSEADARPATPMPVDAWFHVPVWQQRPPGASRAVASRTVLMFADPRGLCDELARRLERAGHRVLVVADGATWASGGPRPDLVVHATAFTGDPDDPAALDRGLYSLLARTQQLDERGWTRDLEIVVLADHLHSVTGERVSPDKAALLGWLKVLPHEYPGVAARCIDLDPAIELSTLADRVARELQVEAPEPVLALRGRHRFGPALTPMRLPPVASPVRLRPRGVYLITGGLGGVGLALAAGLAARVKARLVLVGRTPLPPRARWQAVHDDPATPASERARLGRLLALEHSGAELLALAADVTDRAQMAAVLAQAEARFGAVHGVIHAAGVPGGRAMLRSDPAALAATLAPKRTGARVLAELLGDRPLDFVALCSALVTLTGAFGHLDYAAANAFLDAFAHDQAARGGSPTLAIGWGRWRGVGMAVAMEAQHAALTGEDLDGMAEGDATDAFFRLVEGPLLGGAAQVYVSTRDPAALHLSAAPPERAAVRTSTSGDATTDVILDLFRRLLGADAIDTDSDFFALGGNSLVGTRLVAHLREAFAVDLALRDLFDRPTIGGLVAHIDAIRRPSEPVGEDDERETGFL